MRQNGRQTNIRSEQIELLPKGRDFTDARHAGARSDRESRLGGLSIDGASACENRFIIDGIDTTSPQIGTGKAVPMRADFVEEVQVKSAGYTAEFGGSTGGVVNAITKSGTNNFAARSSPTSSNAAGAARCRAGSVLHRRRHRVTLRYVITTRGRSDPDRSGLLARRSDLPRPLLVLRRVSAGLPRHERTVTFDNGVTNTFDQDFRVHYGTRSTSPGTSAPSCCSAAARILPFDTNSWDLPRRDRQHPNGTEPATTDYLHDLEVTPTLILRELVDCIPTSPDGLGVRAGYYLSDEESTTNVPQQPLYRWIDDEHRWHAGCRGKSPAPCRTRILRPTILKSAATSRRAPISRRLHRRGRDVFPERRRPAPVQGRVPGRSDRQRRPQRRSRQPRVDLLG